MAVRFGRFALFRGATDVNGHRLTRLYHFAGAWQLKENAVSLDLIAGADRAYAKIQTGAGQLILGDESIFADYVRHFHFRTAQRQVDGKRETYEDRDANCDYDSYGSCRGQRLCCDTHSFVRPCARITRVESSCAV